MSRSALLHFFQDGGAGAPTITLPAIPDTSKVVVAYSESVSASGGTAPYTYAVTSGALPTGISLNPNTGALTGTTDLLSADFTFEITATDANSFTGSRTYNVAVNEFFNLLERAISEGSNITGSLVSAYRTLFKSLNTDRTNLVRIERDAFDDFNGFGVPVIHSVDGVTVIGNNVSTNDGFVAGDWSLSHKQGNGAKRLLTGINPSLVAEIPLNNVGLGSYSITLSSGIFAGCEAGAYDGGPAGLFIIPDFAGLGYNSVHDTTVNHPAQPAGNNVVMRNNATDNQLFHNGAFVNSIAVASAFKPNSELEIFKRGGVNDWSDGQIRWTYVFINPTAAMILRLHNAMVAFDTAIGL